MKIVVVGLNHKTAPIQVRERLSFGPSDSAKALERLQERFPEAEFVLLSTCNRVELYSISEREGWENGREVAACLAELRQLDLVDFQNHLYIHVGADAVSHLFKVSASLDSLVLGENQIVGQVKDGYKLASGKHCTGKIMNRLFHSAFSTSKDVHAMTAIGRGRMSVAGVAIELAQQLFADIKRAKSLVIGAGQMGELLVKHLKHVQCADIRIINRTSCRAKSMATHHGVVPVDWDQLENQLAEVDIVIGSAAVEDYLYRKATFAKIMQQRLRNKSLLMIDIAVPRNFDPRINEIENVYLFSVDDLEKVVALNHQTRERDLKMAMDIIAENTAQFMEWFEVRDLGPQIGQLKEAFARISQKELNRFFVGAREEAHCRHTLEPMVQRVTNKILFCLVKHINTTAKEKGTREAARIVEQLKSQADQIVMQEEKQVNPSEKDTP